MATTRNTILDAYKTLFEGRDNISGACRGRKPVSSVHVHPYVMVMGGSEEQDDMLEPLSYSLMSVVLAGITFNPSDPDGEQCELIQELRDAIESDDNLYREDSSILTVDTDEGWMTLERNGLGYFEMVLEVRYKVRS